MPSAKDLPAERAGVGALASLAIRFLGPMQLADGAFCTERVRGELAPRGRSTRYSLMTYIGLARAEAAGYEHPFDLDAIRETLWSGLGSAVLQPGDLGLYLWADAVRGPRADAEALAARAARAVEAAGGPGALEGQEVSWLTIGLARRGLAGTPLFEAVVADLAGRAEPSTGLLYHYSGPHRRRRFANFASQIYGVLALTVAGALPVARGVADRLLELQLEDGGWPWLYDAAKGTVLEPYEVYSVHQHAMAPMALLELADASGERRYAEAARTGLEWIHGRNELGLELVDEQEELIYRSIRRRYPFDRAAIYVSTGTALVFGRGLGLPDKPVKLNPTCRPYELGWLLEAWCGRETA